MWPGAVRRDPERVARSAVRAPAGTPQPEEVPPMSHSTAGRNPDKSARRRRTTAAVLVGALALSSVGLAVGTAVADPGPTPAGATLTGTLDPGTPSE